MAIEVNGTRQRTGWDVALSATLAVLVVVGAVGLSLLGQSAGLSPTACIGSPACAAMMADARRVGSLGPPLLAAATLVATAIAIILKRRAFWFPLVGALLTAVPTIICYLMVDEALAAR